MSADIAGNRWQERKENLQNYLFIDKSDVSNSPKKKKRAIVKTNKTRGKRKNQMKSRSLELKTYKLLTI
jgi:hypothetical protein